MFPFEKHVNIYVVPLQLFYYVQKNIPVMNSVSDWKTRHLKRNRSIYYYQSSWKCGSNLFIIVNLFVEKRKKNKKDVPEKCLKRSFFGGNLKKWWMNSFIRSSWWQCWGQFDTTVSCQSLYLICISRRIPSPKFQISKCLFLVFFFCFFCFFCPPTPTFYVVFIQTKQTNRGNSKWNCFL